MKNFILVLLLLFGITAKSQSLTQTIRGTISDQNTKANLVGVTVQITSGEYKSGAISDETGSFRIDHVPIGRCNLVFSYLGYEKAYTNQLEVTSSKEIVLNIELVEEVLQSDAVIIRARKDKSKTLNKMVSVSGRTFSVEESQRYAGSKGDVIRMAQNFAGVQGADDSRNDIVVRGNSPMGVLYRLNGVDIPNPNHFSSAGTTGGPVSMLNNNVLANSDFLTGAFPAEYGNATAAVFDIGFRKGNNEKYEFLGQVGFAGLELMAEGPFSEKSKASFLVNYRYSALGFFSLIGVNFGTGSAVPKYQDLTFNLNFPDKTGSTQLFGVGGMSKVELYQSEEAGENLFRAGLEDLAYSTNTGVVGLSRFQRLGDKTFGRITFAADVARTRTVLDTFELSGGEVQGYFGKYRDDSYQGKYSVNTFVQHKFNTRNITKAGIRYHDYFFSLEDSFYNTELNRFTLQPFGWVQFTNMSGRTGQVQAYVNHTYKVNSKLDFNLGVNNSLYTFNNSNSLEPRFGLSYKVNKKYTLSAGYGLHSQLPPFRIYFADFLDSVGMQTRRNQDLGFTKSHHFIVANDFSLGRNTRLKIEAYYQHLFEVPIDNVNFPQYSLLNQGTDFGIAITGNMVNQGTGRNYGVEVTFERFLTQGFYYLNTLSLYRSFYTDLNGVEHSTAFDSKYALNLLGGKEFYFKERTNKKGKTSRSSLTTDIKFMVNGGKRYTPIDVARSVAAGTTVLDTANIFSEQYKDYIRLDFRVAYKIQGKKISQEWGVDIQNVTNRRNIFQRTYSPETNEFRTTYQTGLLPVGIYRVVF